MNLSSKCRLCKAEGQKLYLKGDRCYSSKCPLEKRGAVKPGIHGLKTSGKITDYARQLRAKQKVKRIYGLNETQFKNLYFRAKKMTGLVGNNLLLLLERRLDNIVLLAGLAPSRVAARQIIGHGHIRVDKNTLTIPSYPVKQNQQISLSTSYKKTHGALLKIQEKDFNPPVWIKADKVNLTVSVKTLPLPQDVGQGVDINQVIEYYSR
jgi:small subunit ribosomal protein S4